MAKHKLNKQQQAAFEQEQMNRPVSSTGEGEVEAVKALLSPEFETMSNLEASSIALLLQDIIRGQNSLLARVEHTGIEIAKLREHQAGVDEKIASMVANSRKEIEDVLSKSSKLKASGSKKDKIVATGAQLYSKAIQDARANKASSKLQFEEQLRRMPKETIVSPGAWIQTREGMKLIPEEVRIKHKVWYLIPGVPLDVPKAVADVLRDRRKSQFETAQRKEILGKQMEQNKMVQAWNNVNGSKTESMPLA